MKLLLYEIFWLFTNIDIIDGSFENLINRNYKEQFNTNRFKKSFYIRMNRHRKNNDYDYNYDDFGEVDTNIVNYEIVPPSNVNKTITDVENALRNAKEENNTNKTYENTSINTNVITVNETEVDQATVTTTTKKVAEMFVEDTKVADTTVIAPVGNVTAITRMSDDNATAQDIEDFVQMLQTLNTTDTESPPPFSLLEYFPGTTNAVTFTMPLTSTKDPLHQEIRELNKKEGGYTSNLIVLFRVLSAKNPRDVRTLLVSMDSEIERLRAENRLEVFEGSIAEVFQSLIQMLGIEPLDVMQNHLKYAAYALEYRRSILKPDINVLLEIADTIHIPRDTDDIVKVLKTVRTHPNSTESSRKVVHELLQSFVFRPLHRIKGTVREKVIVDELKKVIKRRLQPGDIRRSFGNYMGKMKTETDNKFDYYTRNKHYSKSINERTTKAFNLKSNSNSRYDSKTKNKGNEKTNYYLKKKITRYKSKRTGGKRVNLERDSNRERSKCTSDSNVDRSSDISYLNES